MLAQRFVHKSTAHGCIALCFQELHTVRSCIPARQHVWWDRCCKPSIVDVGECWPQRGKQVSDIKVVNINLYKTCAATTSSAWGALQADARLTLCHRLSPSSSCSGVPVHSIAEAEIIVMFVCLFVWGVGVGVAGSIHQQRPPVNNPNDGSHHVDTCPQNSLSQELILNLWSTYQAEAKQ